MPTSLESLICQTLVDSLTECVNDKKAAIAKDAQLLQTQRDAFDKVYTAMQQGIEVLKDLLTQGGTGAVPKIARALEEYLTLSVVLIGKDGVPMTEQQQKYLDMITDVLLNSINETKRVLAMMSEMRDADIFSPPKESGDNDERRKTDNA